jgi:hypothetical protein
MTEQGLTRRSPALVRVNLPFRDAERDLRIAPDVLNPSGGFTRFGEQIETLAADHKPNFDLPRQTRRTPNRGQI